MRAPGIGGRCHAAARMRPPRLRTGRARRAAAAGLAAVAALGLSGCGLARGPDRPERDATLMLDSRPRGLHAGIVLAIARDFDGAEGVHLRPRVPASATQPLEALRRGGADFAVLDIHDLARARERGHDLVGVMALVQRPLPAFRRPAVRALGIDDEGAPVYPELVLSVTRQTLDEERSVVRATVAALRRGYGEALADPESAISALVERYPRLDRTAMQRSFDAVAPAFTEGTSTFGELRPAALRAWARWEAREGVTKRPPDVARAFAPGF
jgi:ABC-type nitrate/sulfonate/bicarbonate transport system substrate-binding protein